MGGGVDFTQKSTPPPIYFLCEVSLMNLDKYMIAEEGLLFSTNKSRARVLDNIQNIEKGMKSNFDMCEKAIAYLREYAQFIFTHKFLGTDEDLEICKKKAAEFHDKMIAIDYGRGPVKEMLKISRAYLKRNMNKKFNLADYRHENVKSAELELQKKCSEGGEYANKCLRLAEEFEKLEDFVTKGVEKLPKGNELIGALLSLYKEEHNWAKNQTLLSVMDVAKVSR